jgi:hypothetical protein
MESASPGVSKLIQRARAVPRVKRIKEVLSFLGNIIMINLSFKGE